MNNPTPALEHIPVVPSRYAQCLLRFMEIRGISRSALLEGSGIAANELDICNGHINMVQALSLLNRASTFLDDELAPVQMGQSLNLLDHGLAGFVLLNHRSTIKLANMITRYLNVCLPFMSLSLIHDDQTLTVQLTDRWPLGKLRPFVAKIYIGCIHRLCRKHSRDIFVSLDFPSRLSSRTWQSLMEHSTFSFGASQCQVSMTLGAAPLGICDHDMALQLAKIRTRDQLHNDVIRDIPSMVRKVVTDFPGPDCTFERVASQLKMTPRSLRRQLRMHNTTFHHIRSEVRRIYATRYLTDTRLSLEQIAVALGYSGADSFSKAYSAWTGKAPSSIRRSKARPSAGAPAGGIADL